MSEAWEKVRKTAKEVAGEVATLRDEMRVKIHLAAMDAKDAIETLQPELQKLEQDLTTAADEATVKLHLGAMEARDKWHEIEPKLKPALAQIGELGDKAAAVGQRIVDDLASSAEKAKKDEDG